MITPAMPASEPTASVERRYRHEESSGTVAILQVDPLVFGVGANTASVSTPCVSYAALQLIDRLAEQARRLKTIGANWDSYGAPAPNPSVVNYAVGLFAKNADLNLPTPTLVPTRRGGVQLEWHTKRVDLEICINAVGSFTAAIDAVDGDSREIPETSDESVLRPLIRQLFD